MRPIYHYQVPADSAEFAVNFCKDIYVLVLKSCFQLEVHEGNVRRTNMEKCENWNHIRTHTTRKLLFASILYNLLMVI